MFALCCGTVNGPEPLRFWSLPDGRTFLTDSVTLAAVIGVENSSPSEEWGVCVLPDHMPLTYPSAPLVLARK